MSFRKCRVSSLPHLNPKRFSSSNFWIGLGWKHNHNPTVFESQTEHSRKLTWGWDGKTHRHCMSFRCHHSTPITETQIETKMSYSKPNVPFWAGSSATQCNVGLCERHGVEYTLTFKGLYCSATLPVFACMTASACRSSLRLCVTRSKPPSAVSGTILGELAPTSMERLCTAVCTGEIKRLWILTEIALKGISGPMDRKSAWSSLTTLLRSTMASPFPPFLPGDIF